MKIAEKSIELTKPTELSFFESLTNDQRKIILYMATSTGNVSLSFKEGETIYNWIG